MGLTKKEKQRNAYLSKFYGLTLARYKEILELQGGACAICQKPAQNFTRALSVDHSHRGGMVRGLLCHACNRGLKYFGDEDPSILRRAAEHLERNYGQVPERYKIRRRRRVKRRRKNKKNG